MRLFALFLTAAATAPASAQSVGMPAGAREWTEISGSAIWPVFTSPREVGSVGPLPYPSPNYVLDPGWLDRGAIAYVNADLNAQQLRISIYRANITSSVGLTHSMVDAYTIHGPPGTAGLSVTARIRVRVTGSISTSPVQVASGVSYGGFATFALRVGTWGTQTEPTANEQFRVVPFGGGFAISGGVPSGAYGGNPPLLLADSLLDQPLTRTVGQPFEVGYSIAANGGRMGNLAGTNTPDPNDYLVATIDWDLPPGYTITSTRGYIDPTPSCDLIDFNNDGVFPDDQDVRDFFDVIAGGSCGTCNDIDFNNNGIFPEDQDVVDFFNALAGGTCP